MPEDKNVNLMKFWPLVVGILMIAGTWAGIKSHMSNDAIHINEGEKTLTVEEFKNLLKFANHVDHKLPEIESIAKSNSKQISVLTIDFAVFETEFNFLYSEVDGLESKVSRNYVELRNKLE